ITTTSAQADEREKVVKLADIPAPARQTLLHEANGSPIISVEQESEKGKVIYEGHVRMKDDVIGIQVDANGKLLGKHSEKSEKKWAPHALLRGHDCQGQACPVRPRRAPPWRGA